MDQTLKKNVDKAQNKSSGYFPHRFSAVDLNQKNISKTAVDGASFLHNIKKLKGRIIGKERFLNKTKDGLTLNS